MKNSSKVLIIALIAVIGFSMLACGGGSDNDVKTKFEGRWLNLAAINEYGFNDFSFTFTGSNFVFKSVGPQNFTRKGTFTFSDSIITFTPDNGETWSTFTQGYTLTGNILNLKNSNGVFAQGDFTKQ